MVVGTDAPLSTLCGSGQREGVEMSPATYARDLVGQAKNLQSGLNREIVRAE